MLLSHQQYSCYLNLKSQGLFSIVGHSRAAGTAAVPHDEEQEMPASLLVFVHIMRHFWY